MGCESRVFRLAFVLLLFHIGFTTPIDDNGGDRHSRPRRPPLPTNPTRFSARPPSFLRETEDDTPPSSESWRREYGIDERSSDIADRKKGTEQRLEPVLSEKQASEEENVEALSSHHGNGWEFFQAAARFFGFGGKRKKGGRRNVGNGRTEGERGDAPGGQNSAKTTKSRHGDALFDDEDSEEAGADFEKSRPSAKPRAPPTSLRRKRKTDRQHHLERAGPPPDDPSPQGHGEEEEKALGRPEEDLLRAREMREMVHVFHKLFASLERSLDGQQVQRSRGNIGGAEREVDGVKSVHRELPDVDEALAEAENMNRMREAERATRLADEETVMEKGMEDEAEDGVESEFPKSAPAYEVRKRGRKVLSGEGRGRRDVERERSALREKVMRLSEVGSFT